MEPQQLGQTGSTEAVDARDPRRRIPRTDDLLALPELQAARAKVSDVALRGLILRMQSRARTGEIAPESVRSEIIMAVRSFSATSFTSVLNATGVIVHTNLGRAPLSHSARAAIVNASGYADVEMNLGTGKRGARGIGATHALLEACAPAEDALIVNNGAAALLLAVTALGAAVTPGNVPEIVVSRGELVEIGAGFRLPDLMQTTGSRLREVGTTNRTHAGDYARVLAPATSCVIKVHPSNFWVDGFTSGVEVAKLRRLLDDHEDATGHRVPLVVDLGSGLLAPDPTLPQEPDLSSALQAGADLVIASGDKLLGGPQAGLLLGRNDYVQTLATHPLARAVRADKLALAALEATIRGETPPVQVALHLDPSVLRERAHALATELARRTGHTVPVIAHDGRVGGGGAPGVPLPGWALELPEACAAPLRQGSPIVIARIYQGHCLVDLRCVPEADDEALCGALSDALARVLPTAGHY